MFRFYHLHARKINDLATYRAVTGKQDPPSLRRAPHCTHSLLHSFETLDLEQTRPPVSREFFTASSVRSFEVRKQNFSRKGGVHLAGPFTTYVGRDSLRWVDRVNRTAAACFPLSPNAFECTDGACSELYQPLTPIPWQSCSFGRVCRLNPST